MRAIDADKLIRQLCLVSPDCDEFGRGVATGISAAIQKTADTPTLTLDDLRLKGEWNTCSPYDDLIFEWECSICGRCVESEEDYMPFNFCPNCGADMRGGGEEGE